MGRESGGRGRGADSERLAAVSGLAADKGLFHSPPPRRKIDAALPSRAQPPREGSRSGCSIGGSYP